MPYDFQAQGATPQQQLQSSQPYNLASQHNVGSQMGRGQSPGSFNMSGMAGALSDYQSPSAVQIPHPEQQRFLTSTAGAISPYGQSSVNTGNFAVHPSQYGSASQHGHVQHGSQMATGGPSPIPSSYAAGAYFQPQQQQFAYYPGPYGHSSQSPHGTYSAYVPGVAHGYGQQSGDVGRPVHTGYSPGGFPSYGSTGSYLLTGGMPG